MGRRVSSRRWSLGSEAGQLILDTIDLGEDGATLDQYAPELVRITLEAPRQYIECLFEHVFVPLQSAFDCRQDELGEVGDLGVRDRVEDLLRWDFCGIVW